MQGRKHDKGWDSFSGNLLALRQDSYCCTSAASVWPLNHSSFARHCIICQPEPWVSQLDSARVIFPPEYANIVIELHKCLPTDLFKNTFFKNRSTWFKTFSKLVENLRQVTEKQKRTEALPESTETKSVCHSINAMEAGTNCQNAFGQINSTRYKIWPKVYISVL
jgi:hypothetical protein